MKVSLNTVKRYAEIDLPPTPELVKRINEQLGKVEEVIDLSAKYKDAVVARIAECEKHPDADRLSVCKIDVGSGELVQVVCGAPNVRAGMWVVWLPPGAVVPATYDTNDPFTLGARKLRGIMSNGMLASAKELALGDDHDGILEITEVDLPPPLEPGIHSDGQNSTQTDVVLRLGQSFAELFGLNDTIIAIENKMFTHRPDLFGQLGVAREIFAILSPEPDAQGSTDICFPERAWYWHSPKPTSGAGLELTVFNDATDKSPRFMALAMQEVTIKQSPIWLRACLVRWGGKPINSVVDCTNYIMLLTAQPTHAYDYDKLRGHTIGVRMARDGEQARLLNGKTYTLDRADIVIADGEGVIGLAGIMGGGNSEVSATTKNIVLEVASFDMYAVRRSSMRHGLFTDALTRFNKGQSSLQNDRVLAGLQQLIINTSGGKQASVVYDVPLLPEATPRAAETSIFHITSEFINQRLGLKLTAEQVGNLLRYAQFSVHQSEQDSTNLSITVPFWRTDIAQPEDIVEEVGRLYGFSRLPRELPERSIAPVSENPIIAMKQKITQILSGAGANEVKTYSFVPEHLLRGAGQNPDQAYRVSNALSPDLQYYRLSLSPSLLKHVHGNSKSGHDTFALFEIGKVHSKGSLDEHGLPQEFGRVAFVYAAKKPQSTSGSAYFTARYYVERLLRQINSTASVEYVPLHTYSFASRPNAQQATAASFEPSRTAVVTIDGDYAGVVGEYTLQAQHTFKLPQTCAGFELSLDELFKTARPSPAYVPLPRFPHLTQDISLRVAGEVAFVAVYQTALQAIQNSAAPKLSCQLEPLGVYAPTGSTTKTITLRLRVTHRDRTLTDAEVSALLTAVADAVKQACGAEQV
ncbi:phenylalanine--tRNA ligase subunit beta [Candidatus Saccharibacteria bacterium]|nr:phenylalanine--tRNA ligase subunit beta [Candidatus Saccharibacteria bacterium]